MTDELAMATPSRDDEVAHLLLAHAAEAHRLAAWVLRGPVGAEDAVQEAALIAWNRRGRLRNAGTAGTWFNPIVVNVRCHSLRRRPRRPPPTAFEPVIDFGAERLAQRDE